MVSVSSFGQNGIKLLAIGAPSYLLEKNYQAALDEIYHSKICFTLSYYYGNYNRHDVSTGVEFEMPPSMDSHTIEVLGDTFSNWNQIGIDTAKQGAIGETVSCIVSLAQAKKFKENTVIGSLLLQIAKDEAKHATFAWNTLQWLKTYKSKDLDVFEHEWWTDQINNHQMTRSVGNINNDNDLDCTKYGTLSFDEAEEINKMVKTNLIPKLLGECLLNNMNSTMEREDKECPFQIIEKFMTKFSAHYSMMLI